MIDDEKIAKLEIEDGDVLVINSPRRLSLEQRDSIYEACSALLKRINKNAPIMIIEDGMTVEVLKTSKLLDVVGAA